MLLVVWLAKAAKNTIQKLGFVHPETCGPTIGPAAKKLLGHRRGQRGVKLSSNLKGLGRDHRGKLWINSSKTPRGVSEQRKNRDKDIDSGRDRDKYDCDYSPHGWASLMSYKLQKKRFTFAYRITTSIP